MVSDLLFRSRNNVQRKKFVRLVERARDQNVNVLIFSSMHVSGEQLSQLTGIAANLRFPIEGIDDNFEDNGAEADLMLPDEKWSEHVRAD